MKKILIRLVALILLLAMAAVPMISCNKEDEDEDNTVSTVDADKSYKYLTEDVDFGGEEFHILNCLREQWQMISYVTADEYMGSAINDEVFRRTTYIEETLNCKLVEHNYHENEIMSHFVKDVDTGMNELALSYLQIGGVYDTMMTQIIAGRIAAMDDISTIHLDEDYYVEYLTEAMSLGGNHYTTASDAQLNYYEGAWVILFNVAMLNDAGVELPYDLVRDGAWTFDEMATMCTQIATENTDGFDTFVDGGDSVYGFSCHYDGMAAIMTGIGAKYGEKDALDLPVIRFNSMNFIDRAQKVGEFCKTPGPWLEGSGNDATGRNPRDTLLRGRVAFAGTAISIMKVAAEAGVEVGVVPFPKYDKTQEDYYCDTNRNGNYPAISIAYDKKEEIGLILDLMSFEADVAFEQMYFVEHLELRANAGEVALDNIDMLRIIREKITVDPLLMLGIANEFRDKTATSLQKGAGNITSVINEYESSVQSLIVGISAIYGKK